MKKFILIVIMFLFTSIGFSQEQGSFVLFAGYGQSFFADDLSDDGYQVEEAKYLPVGIQVLWGLGNLQLGGEVNYAAVPFTFQLGDESVDLGEISISQLYYGILANFRLGTGSGIIPYIRGGGGMYTGTFKVDFSDDLNALGSEDSEVDFKSTFGFNFGAGIEINLSPNSGIIAELVYHKVNRKLDLEGAEEGKADNAAVQVGFKFGF